MATFNPQMIPHLTLNHALSQVEGGDVYDNSEVELRVSLIFLEHSLTLLSQQLQADMKKGSNHFNKVSGFLTQDSIAASRLNLIWTQTLQQAEVIPYVEHCPELAQTAKEEFLSYTPTLRKIYAVALAHFTDTDEGCADLFETHIRPLYNEILGATQVKLGKAILLRDGPTTPEDLAYLTLPPEEQTEDRDLAFDSFSFALLQLRRPEWQASLKERYLSGKSVSPSIFDSENPIEHLKSMGFKIVKGLPVAGDLIVYKNGIKARHFAVMGSNGNAFSKLHEPKGKTIYEHPLSATRPEYGSEIIAFRHSL